MTTYKLYIFYFFSELCFNTFYVAFIVVGVSTL